MTETTAANIPAQPNAPLADTSDMAQVHRVFRDAIASVPALLETATADDLARRHTVSAYYRNVLALLHAHHDGEEELIWPILIERAPDQADEVQRIAGQHREVDSALTAASAAIETWQQTADDVSSRAAAAALTPLGAALLPHLDEEEAVIVPLAARHIFASEWAELPGHALRTFSGDKLWLALGLIREQMTGQQLAMMDDHMPPPVMAMWRQHEAEFGRFVSDLRRPPASPV